MVDSVFQTLMLLAYFNIALISIAIANYAVSASFLGRESRLSRTRMERRKERLLGKLKELRETNQIASIKKEIREAEKEQNRLSENIFTLSWLGAVVMPSILFVLSFVCAVVGMNWEAFLGAQNKEFGLGFVICSTILMSGGFIDLLLVIRAIDSAARKIPIPEFEVTFENLQKTLKLKRNKRTTITLCVHNKGEDVAESLEIYVHFPDAFEVHPTEHKVVKQPAQAEYPNHNTAIIDLELIHIEVVMMLLIDLTAPDEKGNYEIPIHIQEKKIGSSKHKLSIEVVD